MGNQLTQGIDQSDWAERASVYPIIKFCDLGNDTLAGDYEVGEVVPGSIELV